MSTSGPLDRPTGATVQSATPVPPATQTIVVQAPSSRWGSWWSRLGWMGFIICAFSLYSLSVKVSHYFDTTGGITEKYHSGSTNATTTDKIAIITISGAIMDGDGFAQQQIEKIKKDDHIKGVVLRIDSPGGSVSASDYIYHHLKELRVAKLKKLKEKTPDEKHEFPMIVSMGSMAASGGYYIAMAVGDQPQSIYAEPTTTTGSIGVLIPHYDISGLLEKYDIKDDTIATHPRKTMLSMTKEMTPEERELVRDYINESFSRFKDIIKEGRPHFKKDESALNELATGEIFSAQQAKKSGLVDEIGFIEAAIDRTIELAKLDKEKVRVVKYENPNTLFGMQLAQAKSTNATALEALMELATPKAYYMCTSLPPLMRSK